MDKLKDKIWTWIIVLSMIGYLLLMSLYTQGQVSVDSFAYNNFKNHYVFISQQHNLRIDELENPEKYHHVP